MVPKAVHICHIIVRAPLIDAGLLSAAYMGTVALFGPIPSPKTSRAKNMCCQVCVKPCQRQESDEIMHVINIVPRLPKYLFMGSVSLVGNC